MFYFEKLNESLFFYYFVLEYEGLKRVMTVIALSSTTGFSVSF